MVEIIVVSFILLGLTALFIEEFNLDIYKPVRVKTVDALIYLGEHNTFGQIIKKGIEAKRRDDFLARLKEYKEHLKTLLKQAGIEVPYIYGGDYDWSPVEISIDPEQLHEVRRVLRLVVGSWNDKIEPGSCDEDYRGIHMLRVYYVPKEEMPFPTRIVTKYEIDNLPKGLLKEGCRVEKETITRVTFSVRCEAA